MLLSKHHGLGNDFLIVLDERNPDGVAIDADRAVALCDRHTGLGADGVIRGSTARGVDAVMTLWNADGSRAEISGTGLRCLAQAVFRARPTPPAELAIRTEAGTRRARISGNAETATVDVEAEMGVVSAAPAAVELSAVVEALLPARRIGSATIGNPHVIVEVDDLTGIDLAEVGPELERRLGGVNIELIRPAGPGRLELRVWERGAGLTRACGTGACAAAHWAHAWGMTGLEVAVSMPGGTAGVTVGEPMLLRSPITHVAEVEVAW